MSGTPTISSSHPGIAVGEDGRVRCPARRWRRPLFLSLVTATAALGVVMMFDILRANGITVLEGVILPLFAVTFTWITIASWSAVIGFVLRLARRDPLSLERVAGDAADDTPLDTRTAVVMPVYNEDPGRVAAGLEAVIRDLRATGRARHFAFFLLSDTTDEATAEAERAAWAGLSRRLGPQAALFYRRRGDNRGRKAGNIADFCRRWGGHYDHMIVLDADSLMSGTAMLALVRGMQANPDAGLIQTVPIPVRQRTFFGRYLQFAATLHSPLLATGFSFWQTDAANYWGHNAIIRVSAFTGSCGLPELPGRPPLGGEILSHDFVEAALLRRRGWRCYLFPDVGGSYEEVPGNLLEFVKRDRRWTQGNLQHLKVLVARGLHPVSRLHMVMGVLAFGSSLLWLLMLAVTTVDAVWRAVGPPNFFTDPHQLFPEWPVARPGMITSLLAVTVAVLVLPKVLALILGLVQRRAEFGGAVALACGGAAELAFSVLIAPLMMTFHALFVTGVLLGRQVSWRPQTREGRAVPWGEALRRTAPGTLAALIWGAVTWTYAPLFFWWLTPVLVGLVLAAPIVRLSSSPVLGALAARAGVFLTPAERRVRRPRGSRGRRTRRCRRSGRARCPCSPSPRRGGCGPDAVAGPVPVACPRGARVPNRADPRRPASTLVWYTHKTTGRAPRRSGRGERMSATNPQAEVDANRMANALRFLAADAVEQAQSGHPGLPMGMADVATVLFTRHLRFDAADPQWPDRDRFVLSGGHGSMLLYGLLYLTGYEAMPLSELKRFRQLGSRTPGHPEVDRSHGVETTTGPLGQGIGAAVGMAIAERLMAARFGDELVDHRTWVIASDGDMMEGVSHEAGALAGHLGLGKLIVCYDDNGISIDGPTDYAMSEDVPARFAAYGWDVQSVDGHDRAAVDAAIGQAKATDTPSLIACRTIIGFGAPQKAGTAATHGSPLGAEEIEGMRRKLDWSAGPFEIPEDILAAWREVGRQGAGLNADWRRRLAAYSERDAFERAQSGAMPDAVRECLRGFRERAAAAPEKEATRKASGRLLEELLDAWPSLVGGSADLTPSNNTRPKSAVDVSRGEYGGRYIRYGVREHGMAAAMNGLALHGGLVPYGGTFLTFSDYARPAMRIAALAEQRVVYVMTHDSIGLGEDGPTHQPIEHLAGLRAMPNLNVFRPADAVEVAECWECALEDTDTPSVLALTRQGLPVLREPASVGGDNLSARGAYVLVDADGADVTLLATGSEVAVAVDARARLAERGLTARVVSMPCWERFEAQPADYRETVLGDAPRVAVEAASPLGWDRYTGPRGRFVGMHGFGTSAPGGALFEHFGITADAVADAAVAAAG